MSGIFQRNNLSKTWYVDGKAGQPLGSRGKPLRGCRCQPVSIRPPGARGRNTASGMKVDETYSVPCLWFFFQGNLRYWLEEAECRDQYSVIFESGDRTSIFWNDVKDPVSIEERAVGIRCPWGLNLSFRSRKLGTRAWFSVMFFQTASLRTTSFALLVLK